MTPATTAWALVTDGHARSVSVGYRILEQTELRPGQSKAVSGKFFAAPADRPLRVVSRWTLKEVSLVTIPADGLAGIRSDSLSLTSRSTSMPTSTLSTIPHRNLDQMRLADLAAVTLRTRGIDPPDNPASTRSRPAFPAPRPRWHVRRQRRQRAVRRRFAMVPRRLAPSA
ncbi:MAG: hypothetical protein ACOX1P_18360 [Thermoguttaceae bacterium]